MKFISSVRAGHLAMLAAGVALAFAIAGNAAAAPARSRPVVRTVTHHYSLAASAFAPDGLHDVTKDYLNSWDPSTLTETAGSSRCFNTGLSLPNGATIKSVTAYYTPGTSIMFFDVNRQDLTNHTFTDLVVLDTAFSTTPSYTATTTPVAGADALVNYTKYAYSAGICLHGNESFSGMTVNYTQTVG